MCRQKRLFFEGGVQMFFKKLKIVMSILLIALVSVVSSLFILQSCGKRQLTDNSVGSADVMQDKMSKTLEQKKETKQSRYVFNEDIMTFLIMGIDQRSETVTEYSEGFEGGSADAIFLAVLNPHRKKLQIIAIDRNTMADVDIYDYYGNYEKTIQTQLCVQHGFGDGTVKSAESMVKAVSNLLYGLPINGYCAINMSAIEKINDFLGGVCVTVLEDLTKWDKTLVKGKEVHLKGSSAFCYVQRRDVEVFGSAEGRLERQKQYITALIQKAKGELKKNPALPVTLFREMRPYMTTDLNVEKAAYLAGMATEFDFHSADIFKIEGENVMGEEYEEFYVDEKALHDLLFEIFYEEIVD